MSLLTLKAALRLERVRKELPSVAAYHFPTGTGGRLCLLTVEEGFPRENVIEALVSIPLVRCFIFLNNDVSLHSEGDILWALTQRTEKGRDFLFSSQSESSVLPEKIIIDATVSDLSDWNNRRIQVFEP